ncbi:MAG: NAD(P)-dependent oxidoreductase [Clostridia bacterium]
MRIAVVDRDALAACRYLEAARPDVSFIPVADPASMPGIEADAIFGHNYPASVFDRVKGVRWVQWWSAGVDGHPVPDHLLFTRMVGAFNRDMSEHVLGQVLDFAHQFQTARDQQAGRIWARYPTRRLNELTVGIGGGGEIGRAAGEMLEGLGAAVKYLVRQLKAGDAAPPFFDRARERAFFDDLDVLVLVMPHTADTEGFLNRERLGWLPRGAAVLNIGRGRVVDEDALREALDRGQVARAYLDVQRTEPLPADSWLWTHPRVVITPHLSGAGRDEDVLDRSLENLARFERGEALLGVVDRERGY